jgi:hypothetical protein
MRKLLMTFAFVSTTAVLAAPSADAAARWNCEGAEYVCGSGRAAAPAPSYDASERKATRTAKSAERAPRAQRTAKLDNDEAKPARRARASRNTILVRPRTIGSHRRSHPAVGSTRTQ